MFQTLFRMSVNMNMQIWFCTRFFPRENCYTNLICSLNYLRHVLKIILLPEQKCNKMLAITYVNLITFLCVSLWVYIGICAYRLTLVTLPLSVSTERVIILQKNSCKASRLQFQRRVSRHRSIKACRVVFDTRFSLVNMLCKVFIRMTCSSQLLLKQKKNIYMF